VSVANCCGDGIEALIGWMGNVRSECWRLVPDD
jgi:hypothetical protein